MHVQLLICIWLFVTPWTVACQSPLPWNYPGKNTGVGCHSPRVRIFLTQGLTSIKPASPASAGEFFTTEPPGKPTYSIKKIDLILSISKWIPSLIPFLSFSFLFYHKQQWTSLLIRICIYYLYTREFYLNEVISLIMCRLFSSESL